MEYFVIGPDGRKYGPASVDTLNVWAREGRLLPNSELEDTVSGARLSASSVPGLVFGAPQPGPTPQQPYGQPTENPYAQQQAQNPYGPQQGNWSAPPGGSPYPRQGAPMYAADAQGDITKAFVFGAIGLICCPIVFSVLGIVFALKAKEKGHPTAQAALIFCIVTLVLGAVVGAIIGLGNAMTGMR